MLFLELDSHRILADMPSGVSLDRPDTIKSGINTAGLEIGTGRGRVLIHVIGAFGII